MLNVNGRIKLGVHPLENWGENWSQVDVQGFFFLSNKYTTLNFQRAGRLKKIGLFFSCLPTKFSPVSCLMKNNNFML